jgi:glycine oxidase
VIACGHFRHGILLAPLTAAAVAASVMGREPPATMAPFDPARTIKEAAMP